jgi:hexosaminidase
MAKRRIIWYLICLLIIIHYDCNGGNTVSENRTPHGNATNLIPVPMSLQTDTGLFILTALTQIYLNEESSDAISTGTYLAEKLSAATGFHLNITLLPAQPATNCIILTTAGADPDLGEEGYSLSVKQDKVIISALNWTGLFWGIQTLRQLFPASIESPSLQSGPWEIPNLMIRDKPRFEWRGVMLDVARHFFGIDDVKRLIDEMAYYKLNHLHLHLSDDQGWRIAINSWPDLTAIGGSTPSDGKTGGFYTQSQYADIVAYAQSRKIMIVPEIDMPGHSNAALTSYADLNFDAKAPAPYTGMDVGFSSLAVKKEITYSFIDNVVQELASMTPGPYIHIGGDEALTLADSDYVKFVQRVQSIVQSHNKQLVGWEEISKATLLPSSIIQLWHPGVQHAAISQYSKIIMSPASKTYLDMKYNALTPFGQDWAGFIDVKDSYDWDPATMYVSIPKNNILGIEAPLWTETITTFADAEYMLFPRLPGLAEIGWSPQEKRHWNEYSERLVYHGIRWTVMGINFYKSTQIHWK